MTYVSSRNVAHGFFALAALIFVMGCVRSKQIQSAPPTAPAAEYKPESARLTSTEAIRLAKEEAVRRGVDLRQFAEPLLDYSPNRTNWFLLFWGKTARYPGNYFSVYVNDHTGKTSFMGGR